MTVEEQNTIQSTKRMQKYVNFTRRCLQLHEHCYRRKKASHKTLERGHNNPKCVCS